MRDDLNLRIDRNGSSGTHTRLLVSSKGLVCLFASALTRDAEGVFWLVTPTEIGHVEVEDVPFLAVELFHSAPGRDPVISLRTNVDEIIAVDGDHPVFVRSDPATDEILPYVTVRPGLDARIVSSVYYELVELGVTETIDNAHIYGVWSSGTFFPLGRLEDEE
ncbi:MAG: DUF1285 domain-containing protein [Rhodospirillales bacterium]|nr:DUF1285 domain-containing protein [Rhodospirillales bacterium]